MYLTSTYSMDGKRLLVALPDLGEEEGPIRGQRVDYINRPSGLNAGSGDVLISHVLYSPVDDDIHANNTELREKFGNYTFSFTSISAEHLSQGGIDEWAERYPRGCKYICARYSRSWEVSGMVYKRRPTPTPRWWRLSFGSYYYQTKEEAERAFVQVYNTACRLLDSVSETYTPVLPYGWYLMGADAYECDVTVSTPHLDLYKSRLDSFIDSRQVYDPRIADSGVNAGLYYKAYYDAINKLPVLQQNLMANIVECISTIASFLDGFDASDLRDAKKLAKDLWLQYRYSYSTTISDAEEVLNAVARLDRIAGKKLSTYGFASDSDHDVSCAVELTLVMPSSISGWLKAVNLRPTLSNVWDMVPYSFVVDWFLGLGSILEDLQRWIDTADLTPDVIWYSVWHSIREPGIDGIEYCRFAGTAPALPYFSTSKVGTRTVGFRIADSIALFLL